MVGEPVARQVANMRVCWPWVFARGDGSWTAELPGVMATVVPSAPGRSIFNSVVYEDTDLLLASMPELARIYEDAGVIAWTIWIPEHDTRAREAAEACGHGLDASPAAMEADTGELLLLDPGDLDWTGDADMADVYATNDAAYGMADTPFTNAGSPEAGDGRLYAARLDGSVASVLSVLDVDGDACVSLVATVSGARGRGLSGRLLSRALADARERGMEGTSLQATAAGEPLYRTLGYRVPFRFGMWERRRPA